MVQAKIYVGNIPYSTTKQDLSVLFCQFGAITNVHIATDKETGKSRGFAFVSFAEKSSMTQAIDAMNGKDYSNRRLVVSEAIEKPNRVRV